MNSTLFWSEKGIYEPLPILEQTEWWHNEDGDPLVGVQVDSIDNARKFAAVQKVFAFRQPLGLTLDGQIQRFIGEDEMTAEYESWLEDVEYLRGWY